MANTRTIEVSDETLARVRLLQSAWQASADAVIDRLLNAFMQFDAAEPDRLEVHATYDGNLVKGSFDVRTRHLTITEGPLAGQSFKSPSGAAMALVRHLNPEVHNNRNGWTFWTITGTGHPLQTVRSDGPRRFT
ncbi:hypothetical protein [Amycolatopsis panacis]|uniref:Uncharacterized protein n=1 Tax=Amycolatopsis panacis TaxID=2340917 RepID=A0A419I1U6_9PSEU|nr:hypothetical protein [Amycolatopsis panacis]RJQ83749.1 hypothetical protein D5S19_18985 [Amycolatopsis panacis]